MSKITSEVTQLVAPHCEALSLELVDVEYAKEGERWVLRVLIDKPDGVLVEDCEALSRRIDPILDEADPIPGQYFLEVSSPGLERPLKKPADFDRFAGNQVQLHLYSPVDGKRNLTGTLVGWKDDNVLLQHDGEELSVPFKQVAKANLEPEF